MYIYVTRSRKRGPFPQKSHCELDISADSAKSAVHARENRLTLARSVAKLQSFEYHTCAYLGFEISAFISVGLGGPGDPNSSRAAAPAADVVTRGSSHAAAPAGQ